MKTNEYFNEKIKLDLVKKAEEIEPSDDLFNRIKTDINEVKYEEKTKRGIFHFKRRKMSVAMLTCCILLVISTAVIGSAIVTNIATYRKGSSKQQYDTFPNVDRIVRDVGFAPKYVEILPGGFEFSEGGTGKTELSDEAGNVLTNTKDLYLKYIRGNEKSSLSLNISQIEEEFIDNDVSSRLVDNYNGIDLYYYQKDYKFVPPEYQLTEEDIKANEAGELEISYGSSEISYVNIQSISWYEEGLQYTIMGSDYYFTIEEMVEMSKTIIDVE